MKNKYKGSNTDNKYFLGSLLNKGVQGVTSLIGADPNNDVSQIIGSTLGTVGDIATGNIPGAIGQGADLVGDVGTAAGDESGVTQKINQVGQLGSMIGGSPLFFKGGGYMNTYQNGGELIQYEGNTHQNGGIPLGNTGNEVEDNETNFDDYIFSDALKVNKQLVEEYSLPKKSIGKTFADVSKFFNDEDRPNDIYTKNMREKDLTNLRDAQESFKQVELQSELEKLQFKYGGELYDKGGQTTPKYNNITDAVRNESFLHPYLKRSMKGLSNISNDPESVYNVFDGLDNSKRSEFAKQAYTDYIREGNNQYQSGGPLLDINSLIPIDDLATPMSDPAFANNQMTTPLDPVFEGMSLTSQVNLNNRSLTTNPNLQIRDNTNIINDQTQTPTSDNRFGIDPSILRYAPIATDLATLGMTAFNKPDPTRESTYDTNVEINPNLVNRDQIKRDITSQEGAITNQITEASGGSAGALLGNLQGVGLNTQKALANANIQADVADQRELARVQGVNLQQQSGNMGRRMQVSDWNARDLGQYNTMLMDSISNVGQNIGNVGTEEYYRKLASQLPIGYTIDRQGNIIKKPTE